jgi:hypothetical protein
MASQINPPIGTQSGLSSNATKIKCIKEVKKWS